ncbi:hypothetical protein EV426DRAFT_701992 [Tirmania nivea]|nr:hypothetical protein EV426DRAFT_701992 [Tirmania nivea]
MNQQIHLTTGYNLYELIFKQKVYYLPGCLSSILDANDKEVEDDDEEVEDDDKEVENEDNKEEEEEEENNEEKDQQEEDNKEDEEEEEDEQEEDDEEDSLIEPSTHQSTSIQLKLPSTDIMLAKVRKCTATARKKMFTANTKAYILTIAANAKKKDVHVLPTVILDQGRTHIRIQYKS